MDAAVAFAAAAHMDRDVLWENRPPLLEDCEHDLRCLPVIEPRQTVICIRCRGLDAGLSREITRNPGGFKVYDDGVIAQNIEIRRRDPADAAERIRAGYREHGIPDDMAEAMIAEILKP